ncbi:hypothetical protein, unlikely [Trypanosoma brucei gambiense DAL972]|uniref:T. brucei spp.-specific protein n=1 Tax=Trypanosoma brucei gambiense (strain MHOM/CI/86/DAL972) TaxID=679716 RepID=D0A2V0_TRYB9|nr:hypothetical protein, unlikely [Trypanosoma brucei gambiense DAL972]CBH15594.1 hypothetical protein, unlikely [Trypanosoma brucei gambiense DAL972]|eukprot:XP_011777858.1 hypothetical protein, unlikely [Trypanosoma brucei gambiense DAL972]
MRQFFIVLFFVCFTRGLPVLSVPCRNINRAPHRSAPQLHTTRRPFRSYIFFVVLQRKASPRELFVLGSPRKKWPDAKTLKIYVFSLITLQKSGLNVSFFFFESPPIRPLLTSRGRRVSDTFSTSLSQIFLNLKC